MFGGTKKFSLHKRKVKEIPGCLIFYVKGYFSRSSSDRFQGQVKKAIEAGYKHIVFNLAKLKFYAESFDEYSGVFSDFLANLTVLLKKLQQLGGNLILIEVPPSQLEVFQLFGAAALFNIKDNLDEAIVFFNHSELFPKTIRCPICNNRYKVQKAGTLVCTECKTALIISEDGSVYLE